jgi:hypothetical protein
LRTISATSGGLFSGFGFALVVLAGLIDRDGRIRVDAASLGRVIAYFLTVLGVAVVVV